jgi:hypothetical protein
MKYVYVFIAGVIVALICSDLGCTYIKGKKGDTVFIKGKAYEVIKTEIDTQYLTKTTVVEGKPVVKDTTIYVSVPQKVDTLSILREFYAKNVLLDTIKLTDSLGYVYIRDTISQNQLQFRSLKADVRERTITKETFLAPLRRNTLLLGVGLTQNQTPEVSAIYGLKNRLAVKVGYTQQGATFGAYYKIK